MPIEVIDNAGYLAARGRVRESEECLTHLADVFCTTGGAVTGYVKFYPDVRGTNRGLINEICGYIIAEALGLPTSRRGLILLLLGRRLVEVHPMLRNRIDGDSICPVWVSEEVKGLATRADSEKLQTWKLLPELIAFDDWLANTDRHLGNILRTRQGRFVLIDHGHLLGSVYWTPELLSAEADFTSGLMSALWDGQPPNDVVDRVLEASRAHPDVLNSCSVSLFDLIGRVCESERDRDALRAFIEIRAQTGFARLKRRFGVLL